MGIIGAIAKSNTKKNPITCCVRLELIPLMLLTNQTIKLILHEGTTKVIKRRMKIKAGEIMFEFPDCVVCHADSFFLGKPIPILSIHDHLVAGRSYFVLPLDRLPATQSETGSGGALLSAASLCYLGSPSNNGNNCPNAKPPTPPTTMLKLLNGQNNNSNYRSPNNSKNANNSKMGPFEYVKDKDGRVLMIKVVPEFITRIITNNSGTATTTTTTTTTSISAKLICSTPELQKQYEQLVRAKDQAWSPKLKTISEHNKNRFSPSRLIRLEWKDIEK